MMKKRLLALVLLVALCVPMLAACGRAHSPSKGTVEQCAKDVLSAVMKQNTSSLQSLANPDYAGYFTQEEMAPYYAQYEEWGICDTGNRIGSMTLVEWYANVDYPGGLGSEATYEVSIGGIFYEYVIHVVKTDAGVGVVFFDLYRMD